MLELRAPETDEEWAGYYGLRYNILRKPWNQPEGSEHLPGDEQAVHVAAFDDQKHIVGVARLHFPEPETGQMRGVAVSEELQGQGIGKSLMQYLEEAAQVRGADKIVLDARWNAVPFYVSLGYKILKESYLLFGQIQHYTMVKKLVATDRPATVPQGETVQE